MPDVIDRDPVTTLDAMAKVTDRRRPGRIENVNPALIPLLRKDGLPPLMEVADADLAEDADQLGAVRGIATAMMFSAGMWGVAGYGLWRLFQ